MANTKNATLALPKNRLVWACVMVVVALTVVTTSALLELKSVTITDGESTVTVRTMAKTVSDALSKQGITLGEKDLIHPPLDYRMERNQAISITRAFPVTVIADGNSVEVKTVTKTVSEVLADYGIVMDGDDVVNPPLDSQVADGTVIHIVRVTFDTVTTQESVPYQTISKPNSSLERGKTRVVQEGKEGTKELVYQVVSHDGEETQRQLIGERMIEEPVDEITEYGVNYIRLSSRGIVERDARRLSSPADELSYSQALTCTATAYDLSYESCGKHPGDPYYGISASGMQMSRGVVAVDPSVIPMGTKLYIESLDSYPDYGFAVAGDTGGAIKGNKVDLFMDSRSEALQFGRRKVKVYILE